MARRRSNPLALAVLGCLTERPMHPYEISTTLRHRGKEQSIKLNYGALYSVVESLQKHGLIAPQETLREGRRPERTVYAITDAGTTEFEDWLSELIAVPTKEFTSLEAGLSLMPGLPPDEVVRLLEERCDRLVLTLRTMKTTLAMASEKGLPGLFLVEDDYRRAMVEAELGYVATLVRAIREGELSGTAAWRRLHELRAQGLSIEEIFSDPIGYFGEEGRFLTAGEPPGATTEAST